MLELEYWQIKSFVNTKQCTNCIFSVLLHGGGVDAPRVAISAYLDHYLDDLGPMQIVPNNKVSLNEGAVYNNSTGVFVAPVSGTYLFSLFSVASRPPG